MGGLNIEREGLVVLANALGGGERLTRFVGGAVRDTLAGQTVKDIDLATRLTPEEVIARLDTVKIKAIPTGIAHGTVTAVLPSGPVEVTTLRRDVSTDGRRATVAFTDEWKEDAARRDFTINALYADPVSGEVFDYFGGLEDLKAGIVRFIGEPLERIAEDHLRILRFFRFHARFGKGDPDAAALAACAARANDLMALSRERIADELLKILALPDPGPTVALMIARGILRPVIPEVDEVDAMSALKCVPRGDSILGIAGLLPADPHVAEAVANRLRLSKAQTKRLILAAGRHEDDGSEPRALAYRLGLEAARDRLILTGAKDALEALENWVPPRLPISGGAIVGRGIKAGPTVARLLKTVENRWIAEGFPGPERVEQLADTATAEEKEKG
jgi:poly(A) polymerase